ncbi:MAG: ribonuclease P protein component [Candidatus Gastranaerophilaceae bacterium]|jgi:ribonuclease P protein component
MGSLSRARISKKKDFDNIFSKGKSFYSEFLGIKSLKNSTGQNRLAIIISTKISKKAAERNKIRRKIREAIRNEKEKMKKGHDIVVITLRLILKTNSAQIKEEIIKGLKRLKILA